MLLHYIEPWKIIIQKGFGLIDEENVVHRVLFMPY